MAQFKFSCPSCAQHIECDEQWGGHQIQCPACQGNILVPRNPSAAPPPPPPPPPLRSAPPPPPPRPAGVQPRLPLPPAKQKAKSNTGKVVKITVISLVAVVGLYFAFAWLVQMQNKISTAVDQKGDGGEMGHIADLYDVLDKTDPEHPGMSSAEAKREEQEMARLEARMKREQADMPVEGDAEPGTASAVTNEAPVIPAVWTLDLATSTIPDSRVNGGISGKKFVADSARIVRVGSADVLSFRQGELTADAELSIYLRLNRGEQLAGNSWTITQDMKGKEVPQVIKRWKKDPRYAATQQAFTTGYAMKLEFAEMTNGVLPGKIFVALPDSEQSVAAGVFQATLPTTAARRQAGRTAVTDDTGR